MKIIEQRVASLVDAARDLMLATDLSQSQAVCRLVNDVEQAIDAISPGLSRLRGKPAAVSSLDAAPVLRLAAAASALMMSTDVSREGMCRLTNELEDAINAIVPYQARDTRYLERLASQAARGPEPLP